MWRSVFGGEFQPRVGHLVLIEEYPGHSIDRLVLAVAEVRSPKPVARGPQGLAQGQVHVV